MSSTAHTKEKHVLVKRNNLAHKFIHSAFRQLNLKKETTSFLTTLSLTRLSYVYVNIVVNETSPSQQWNVRFE